MLSSVFRKFTTRNTLLSRTIIRMASQEPRRPEMNLTRRIIDTPNAPAAIGAYSQAVQIEYTLYVSGQIGLNPETGEMVPGGVAAETAQVLKNLDAILKAAGTTFKNVIKTTIFLQDINDFTVVNNLYAKAFVDKEPARAAVQAGALPKSAKVEIEAVAVIGTIVDASHL